MSNTNPIRKKRKVTKTKAYSTSSIASSNISNPRANASFARFFYQDDEIDSTVTYCKLCSLELDELDGIQAQPYPYSKSGSSTGNLIKHLREKHKINSKNYKRYLDDNEQPIINRSVESTDLDLPSLSPEQQPMLMLVTSLRNKTDAISRREGEKLLKLCLTAEEQEFVKQMVNILKPFEEITRHICGSKYPILNLVHPYIRTLKNKFAPKTENGELFEAWINLIYGSEDLDTNNDSSFSSDNEADIPSAGNRRQWQYAHRSAYRRKNHVNHRKKKKTLTELDDSNTVEYLSPVNCSGLLEKAQAAIFLSLDELWSASNEMGLKASILDPRALKLLPFATIQEREKTEAQIRTELLLLEAQLNNSSNNEEIEKSSVILNEDPQDSLSAELWGSCLIPDNIFTEDEFTRYMKEQIAHKNQNPLIWWEDRRTSYPFLGQLARKYLSIPATSVPSERLFSDANIHISARRTRLDPHLVDKMLFLKRNADHHSMFPSDNN
ncbi:2215_t:CDS:2 [Cetraspora pellucida]|uniref:2215_t:CDS:1 n=1 Tax=Cetraspora pellucida TaxID=1433469 RepID=A0A9N9E6I1_9GLOM|nr:2215_t:CDS:2 [Cetraspora pellucida]